MFSCNRRYQDDVRLEGKTIVITGANTGLGKECARNLYRRGARVILACRDLNKANAAVAELKTTPPSKLEREQFDGHPGELVVCKLDLCSLASVRECAKTLIDTETNIHILINNAGVFMCPFAKTEDGYETHFQSNHLGHFLLTLLLLPKIMKSTPARIINVSSVTHYGGYMNFDDLNFEKRSYRRIIAYNQSKLANVLFSNELARRLKDAKIDDVNVYSLQPGVIATEAGRHLNGAIIPGAHFVFKTFCAIFGKTTEQGIQAILHCATSAKAGNETGLYYRDRTTATPSGKARNPESARKLWNASLEMVGLEHKEDLRELLIANSLDAALPN